MLDTKIAIYDLLIAHKSLENAAKFKYLGTTIANQNWIQEEIKSRSNSGKVCYHSVQSLLSSHLLPIYKTTVLSLVLYGCETFSL